jgi:hypothetical protein
MVAGRDDCHLSDQRAAGHRIIRLKSKGMKAPAFPKSRHWTEPTPPAPAPAARRPQPPARPRPPQSSARKLAVDLLPPVVTRAIRKARAGRPGR